MKYLDTSKPKYMVSAAFFQEMKEKLCIFWRTAKCTFSAVVLCFQTISRSVQPFSGGMLPCRGWQPCCLCWLCSGSRGGGGSCGAVSSGHQHSCLGSTGASPASGDPDTPLLSCSRSLVSVQSQVYGFITVYAICRSFWTVMDHNLFPLAKKWSISQLWR